MSSTFGSQHLAHKIPKRSPNRSTCLLLQPLLRHVKPLRHLLLRQRPLHRNPLVNPLRQRPRQRNPLAYTLRQRPLQRNPLAYPLRQRPLPLSPSCGNVCLGFAELVLPLQRSHFAARHVLQHKSKHKKWHSPAGRHALQPWERSATKSSSKANTIYNHKKPKTIKITQSQKQ